MTDTADAARSLPQRLLARIARIEPGEGASVAAAFLLFFFVLGSYFAVRPVREPDAAGALRDRLVGMGAVATVATPGLRVDLATLPRTGPPT